MEESPSQEFEFLGMPRVKLLEDFENDTANGTRLWEAGMLLCRYGEKNDFLHSMRGQNVLELGAGTGLLSIYLAHCGAKVLCTDNNGLVFALLKRNLALNKVSGSVQAKKLDWSVEKDISSLENAPQPWDFIMGADCVFSLVATQALVACLDRVMAPQSVCLMSIETRDDAVTEAFVAGMRERDFEVSKCSLRGIPKKYLHEDLAIFRCVRKV